jgi:hypothetical protein
MLHCRNIFGRMEKLRDKLDLQKGNQIMHIKTITGMIKILKF